MYGIIKNPKFMPHHYETWSKWLSHNLEILLECQLDWIWIIAILLLMANFGASHVFLGLSFKDRYLKILYFLNFLAMKTFFMFYFLVRTYLYFSPLHRNRFGNWVIFSISQPCCVGRLNFLCLIFSKDKNSKGGIHF